MCSFTLFEDGSKFNINTGEGYVALYEGKKLTKEEYDILVMNKNKLIERNKL
ncbi:hypothetical protein [Clostridium beijerinckii]|uniref:hypothetical protein n=1 Tax=Clostridium beijerinckii TaxID=1520 RepID=UPI0015713C6E|nr:hypothetical protein [Clostridium beijerinckii]NRU52475.1 hypothetical protein [Clostridium beijerinckii]NYC69080.1 hypothetical protein [Clostridium beijerinckii]NYC91666.1 hypothetical protein [Clostridium beijerinckii]NYC91676.1 hypothetical protein [Clostridium beijerinckii]